MVGNCLQTRVRRSGRVSWSLPGVTHHVPQVPDVSDVPQYLGAWEKKIGLKNMTCKDLHWIRSRTLGTKRLPANPTSASG